VCSTAVASLGFSRTNGSASVKIVEQNIQRCTPLQTAYYTVFAHSALNHLSPG
jgi:hypothetical protein